MDKIVIKGAKQHNLKNINVEIPKNKLVVFTGLSGSGKSSMAFDTIYAEGQRRYVESLSAYARQFLGVMDKPDVEQIEGLSPAISIDQKSTSHNPRSTVGTVTEIYDYFRLLFARLGHPHCPICGREIAHMSVAQIVEEINKLARAKINQPARVLILAPLVRDRKGEFSQLFDDLRKKGYSKIRLDGNIKSLDEDFVLIKTNKHNIDVVIDRLALPAEKTRLTEAVEMAANLGEGVVIASLVLDKSLTIPEYPSQLQDHLYSEKFACPQDNLSLAEIEPRTFSFNSPHGACLNCSGLGSILEIDSQLIVNPRLSFKEGGVFPWAKLSTHETWFARVLEQVAMEHNFSLSVPIGQLTKEASHILLHGTKDRLYKARGPNRFGRIVSWDTTFEGVIPNLMRKYKDTESDYIRREIEKFMRIEVCPLCLGTRLKKEALSITIAGISIANVTKQSIIKTKQWIDRLPNLARFSERELTIATPIIKELTARLQFLIDVGLDYLTLDRAATTLAGGEAQRIRLASQIGSGLSGVLYVLDEPTIGLHERDNNRLITTLKKLRDIGNSVIVVEHDAEMIKNSDWILDFGPGAGEHGGEIVAQGALEQIIQNPLSLTGQYLSGKRKVTVQRISSTDNSNENGGTLTVVGAREHNLQNITVDFPLGKFICVTGVSGSGKSSLVHDVLYKAMATDLYRAKEKAGEHDGILGADQIDKVILIDQSPIGRTPRSNPATYTGAFTHIRQLFALTTQARIRGYKAGRFSFNLKGGRCEACEGDGQVKIEMQFLPDVYVDCEVCQGKRYSEEVLEVHYKGKNIAEVLAMTVEEALVFFQNIPPLSAKLTTLQDVGLGYIHLGQAATTLSGGEAQRVKLSTELSRRPTGHTLYILDEPTTGLHFADIERLLNILHRLVKNGNTVITIEHNLDVIKNADWIIDLGPEGGSQGGQIVAQGTLEQLCLNTTSHTGQFLARAR